MKDEGLLPCGFCGFKDEAMTGAESRPGLRHSSNATMDCFWISCDNCLCSGPIAPSREKATQEWNTRHPAPAPAPLSKGGDAPNDRESERSSSRESESGVPVTRAASTAPAPLVLTDEQREAIQEVNEIQFECERYWAESNIPDAEIHAALAAIHNRAQKIASLLESPGGGRE